MTTMRPRSESDEETRRFPANPPGPVPPALDQTAVIPAHPPVSGDDTQVLPKIPPGLAPPRVTPPVAPGG